MYRSRGELSPSGRTQTFSSSKTRSQCTMLLSPASSSSCTRMGKVQSPRGSTCVPSGKRTRRIPGVSKGRMSSLAFAANADVTEVTPAPESQIAVPTASPDRKVNFVIWNCRFCRCLAAANPLTSIVLISMSYVANVILFPANPVRCGCCTSTRSPGDVNAFTVASAAVRTT